MRRLSLSLLSIAAVAVASSRPLAAQRGPAPDPLVKENADGHARAAHLRDSRRQRRPGAKRRHRRRLAGDARHRPWARTPERRHGAARSRKGQQEYRGLHRLDAFPCRAHDRLHRLSARRRNTSTPPCRRPSSNKAACRWSRCSPKRSEATAEILKDAARRPAAITFDRTYTLDLGGVRVRFMVVGPTHTKRRHRLLRRRRQRPLRRRRRHEQLVPRGVGRLEHEGVAGSVRHVRRAEAADRRAGAWRRRTGHDHRQQPHASCRAFRHAPGRSRPRAGRRTTRRKAVQAEFQAQHPEWPRANGLADRGQVRLRRSAVEPRTIRIAVRDSLDLIKTRSVLSVRSAALVLRFTARARRCAN